MKNKVFEVPLAKTPRPEFEYPNIKDDPLKGLVLRFDLKTVKQILKIIEEPEE